MNKLICMIFGHKLRIMKHLKGDIKHGVRTIYCPRCKHYFVMSDEHKAFLRFDNDETMQRDLKFIYQTDSLVEQKQGPDRIS